MRIGIDLRAMQLGHQFRGIGEVVRQSCRQLDARSPATDEVVAFVDEGGPSVAHELEAAFGPERTVGIVELPHPAHPRLAKLQDSITPERAAAIARSCDVLVQFDFSLGIPPTVPTIVVVYDQVPVLLGDRYPHNYRPTYRGARIAGLPVHRAAEKALGRAVYERHLTHALERASRLVAISEHTAETTRAFAEQHGVRGVEAKLSVARLGHTPPTGEPPDLNAMERARFEALGLTTTPFVFFMGGSDERRRIDLLVAAFNDLRARGADLKLVLAGYDFVTMEMVLSEAARLALLASSYRHDIHLLGFASDAERHWLYDHAEAFAFPTEHEGFGLPVVESLAMGCTVVAFDNTSLREVAGPNCELVAGTWPALAAGIEHVLARADAEKAEAAAAGRAWAATFTWDTIGAELRARLDELG